MARRRRPDKRSRSDDRAGIACDQCREKKVRCDEGRPRCSRCVQVDLPCTFSGVDRRRVTQSRELSRSSDVYAGDPANLATPSTSAYGLIAGEPMRSSVDLPPELPPLDLSVSSSPSLQYEGLFFEAQLVIDQMDNHFRQLLQGQLDTMASEATSIFPSDISASSISGNRVPVCKESLSTLILLFKQRFGSLFNFLEEKKLNDDIANTSNSTLIIAICLVAAHFATLDQKKGDLDLKDAVEQIFSIEDQFISHVNAHLAELTLTSSAKSVTVLMLLALLQLSRSSTEWFWLYMDAAEKSGNSLRSKDTREEDTMNASEVYRTVFIIQCFCSLPSGRHFSLSREMLQDISEREDQQSNSSRSYLFKIMMSASELTDPFQEDSEPRDRLKRIQHEVLEVQAVLPISLRFTQAPERLQEKEGLLYFHFYVWLPALLLHINLELRRHPPLDRTSTDYDDRIAQRASQCICHLIKVSDIIDVFTLSPFAHYPMRLALEQQRAVVPTSTSISASADAAVDLLSRILFNEAQDNFDLLGVHLSQIEQLYPGPSTIFDTSKMGKQRSV